MKCDSFLLPKSVVADADPIQMLTLQVRVWAENAGVGLSQWAAETMGIWQDKCGLTIQQRDNKVREPVWEIAQSMSIIKKQGASPKQWNLLIDSCITPISDLESNRPLCKQYMADNTNLDGQKLQAALDGFVEVGHHRRKNSLKDTRTKKPNLVYVGMYFIALLLHLLFLMFCRSIRQCKRNISPRTSPIMVLCNVSTDSRIVAFSFTITFVDPDIAGKRVGETNTQLFSWHWSREDESILRIVT
jgi:hypothetical protein